jgi:hypothetical protein
LNVVLLSRICREHPAHVSGTPLPEVVGSAMHGLSRREDLTHVTACGSPRVLGLLGLRRFEGDPHWRYPSVPTLVLGGCDPKSFRQFLLLFLGLCLLHLLASLIGVSLQPLFPRVSLPLGVMPGTRGEGASDKSLGARCCKLFPVSHRRSSLPSGSDITRGPCRRACDPFLYPRWEGFNCHCFPVNFLLE